jgi:hypothetical protein
MPILLTVAGQKLPCVSFQSIGGEAQIEVLCRLRHHSEGECAPTIERQPDRRPTVDVWSDREGKPVRVWVNGFVFPAKAVGFTSSDSNAVLFTVDATEVA